MVNQSYGGNQWTVSDLLAAQEGGAGVAAEHAYLATLTVMAAAAGFLFPVAITAYGLGMLKESGWPGWPWPGALW